jgi:hypothetical protein
MLEEDIMQGITLQQSNTVIDYLLCFQDLYAFVEVLQQESTYLGMIYASYRCYRTQLPSKFYLLLYLNFRHEFHV